jgi:ubiquinone/menaquinone biosynthesis C-methylase UbiE
MKRHPQRDFLVIDKSPVWIELRKNISVPYVVSDLYHLPFRDNIFDAIFIGEVLEHLLSPETCLRMACGKLKRGGYILGTVPNFFFYRKRMRFLRGEFSEGGEPLSHEHIRFFSKEILYTSLKNAGLRGISIYGFFPPVSKSTLYNSLLKNLSILSPSLFAMAFVFKAQKAIS